MALTLRSCIRPPSRGGVLQQHIPQDEDILSAALKRLIRLKEMEHEPY